MANRRFEMHEYRHVIQRMRLGESDRAIAKSRLMGRLKCAQLRELAIRHGWLRDGPLMGWLKETNQTMEIYHEFELVPVHGRLRKPKARSTVEEHLPPEAVAYRMQDPHRSGRA